MSGGGQEQNDINWEAVKQILIEEERMRHAFGLPSLAAARRNFEREYTDRPEELTAEKVIAFLLIESWALQLYLFLVAGGRTTEAEENR